MGEDIFREAVGENLLAVGEDVLADRPPALGKRLTGAAQSGTAAGGGVKAG